MDGQSAISALSLTNPATEAKVTIPAGTVPASLGLDAPSALRSMMDRVGLLAWTAATDAVSAAGLDMAVEDPGRVGVATGSCMNGIGGTDTGFQDLYVKKKRRVHPFTLLRTMPNAPTSLIAGWFRSKGPALHYSTTCSSSSVAAGEAARMIRHDYADVMIAGGSEALLNFPAVNCWESAQLLAPLSPNVHDSCRPFDLTRQGAVLGEGAAFVVLESWEHVTRRNGPILGELCGYGCTADSGHPTQPSPSGQSSAMRAALLDAKVACDQIGYLHAHGTGTKLNDTVETYAIKDVFGSRAERLPVSSSKSMVGHMVGAAGAFGLFVATTAIHHGQLPPTANLWTADPQCDLDYIPLQGRMCHSLRYSMTNSFGFGGTSASLVVKHS